MKEFNKVFGYKNEKIELERIADMMLNPDKYQKLGVKTTRGLLLVGEPGVGKTLMANCLIKASKRKAFTIRKNIPDGDFVKALKNTFDSAISKAPSIVFLDDIDKFSNEDRVNTEEFVTIQSCIDDSKDKEVFVLATANDTDCLPRSLLRAGRFDKIIHLECPEGKDAEDIVRHYLSKKKVVKDVNYKEITKLLDGSSCALLETIINEAGVYAGFENKDAIGMDEIIRAFTRFRCCGPESLDLQDSSYLRSVAVHEAGHILVSEILQAESVNFASVKHHKGKADGFVSFCQGEDYFHNIKLMENRVLSLLGGKAATEVVYGTTDVGASNDISRAFNIVERFINDYCTYGFNYYEVCTRSRDESDALLERKVTLIQSEIERYYQQAKKIIIDNREYLDKLTDSLVEKKTLLFGDIQNIKKGCKLSLAS